MTYDDLSANAKEWLEVIQYNPFDWAEGMLLSALDRDGVCAKEQDFILRRYKTFLN